MDTVALAAVTVVVLGVSAGFAVGKFLVSLLWPSRENDTILQLEAHFRREQEQTEQRALLDEEARELERLTTALEVITIEQHRQNEAEKQEAKRAGEQRQMREAAAARTAMIHAARARELERTAAGASRRMYARQEADEQTRLLTQQGRQQQEMTAAMVAEQAEQAVARLRVQAEERRRLEEQKARIAREKEMLERRAAEEQERERRESEELTTTLASGIQPLVWPTEQEYLDARIKVQYSRNHFSFAVAGVAGTGKSSLINMFLNLPDYHPDAAPTGVVETTSEIRRYPDPGDRPPRKWTVWYDIPGAGTLNIPGWQYFNRQSLFVFDLIIVLVGDRMTQVDLEILKNSKRFQIPTFIVRSKADQYITNTLKSNGYENGELIPDDRRKYFRDDYITKTRASIASQLTQAALPQQPIYIVSCSKAFREEYAAFTAGSEQSTSSNRTNPDFIDEKTLIHDLMSAAAARRCEPIPTPQAKPQPTVRTSITAPHNRRGGTRQFLCQECLPRRRQFASDADLQSHRTSAAHSVASSSVNNSNRRNRTEDVVRVPAGTPRRGVAPPVRPPPPAAVDVGEWAQAMGQTLAGTAKATFSIDMLQDLNSGLQQTQLLVISPTKLLATEICTLLESLGTPINLRCYACIGGTPIADDQRLLSARQHVVCGTPGRIADLIQRRMLRTNHVKMLVFNMDAKLLTPSFRATIQQVHAAMPEGVKVIRGAIASTGRRR